MKRVHTMQSWEKNVCPDNLNRCLLPVDSSCRNLYINGDSIYFTEDGANPDTKYYLLPDKISNNICNIIATDLKIKVDDLKGRNINAIDQSGSITAIDSCDKITSVSAGKLISICPPASTPAPPTPPPSPAPIPMLSNL